jgi:hypothetical protein
MRTFFERHICELNQFGDLETLQFIKDSIEKLNVDENRGEITCHSLCRAFSRILNIPVETGYFILGYEHSWLITEFENIIDVYPWGVVGGPIFVAKQMRNKLIYQKARISHNIVDNAQIKFLEKQIRTFI